MLLRDLKMQARNGDGGHHHFDCITIPTKAGCWIYIEKRVPPHEFDGWHIYYCWGVPDEELHISKLDHEYVYRVLLDEFEAQAVLDHYLQIIGPPEEVTHETT